jgi:m7GpppX diphosphatase
MNFSTKDNNYQFIPNSEYNLSHFTIQNKLFQNAQFCKYNVSLTITGELIEENINQENEKIKSNKNDSQKNQNQNKNQQFIIIPESYDDYLTFLHSYPSEKDQWIYNIINGKNEQDQIIFQDDQFILLPNYTWVNKKLNYMHLLSFPKDSTLRTLRSLEGKHVPFLKYLKKITCEKIKECYDLDENQMKAFIHYAPSTYHLHIHFVHIHHPTCESSTEYSHFLDDVIYNLSMQSDYYQNHDLRKRVYIE